MMRKLIFLFFMLTLYLTFPTPAMSEFYYVIQLKNGGTLATPLYWSEGKQVYFFYAGGAWLKTIFADNSIFVMVIIILLWVSMMIIIGRRFLKKLK